ncbi:hypothetical protein ARC20_03250 [Stenotrophomonas panacihumi]|uniref:Glycoside hydrolase family 19 catalytic domain-containing protein n=2 Tax=Stenotrophomonas panacihumi TaxID=676599 RepID=A0A0R0AQC9_9GAMM|nr:hypothetical protein ARC20_03250 [Stenotrophomonas panacihumi]PTN55935.1 hypothetical protein C9J98_04490 [Stenotrophomonas panacihumi]
MGAGIYAKPLEDACVRFGIESTLEKAHFLAQVAHESDGFRTAEEYASGKAYDTGSKAKALGNTPEADGDGQRHKGMGLIQVTGVTNQRAYSRWKYGDDRVLNNPRMLTLLPDAVDSAAWYWCIYRPSIRALARADDLEGVTRKINGGLTGLDDRRRRLQQAKRLFGLP